MEGITEEAQQEKTQFTVPFEFCDALIEQLVNIPNTIPSLLTTQSDYLQLILKRSLSSHENSSVLVIGPPGSGKSLLVSHCLNTMKKSKRKYQILYIRGGLITNELSVINQIQSQFNKIATEMDQDEGSDGEQDESDDEIEASEEVINKNLMYLEEKLQESKRKGILTIIVIDKMEVACKQAKRTLYHIANASHMKEANLLIIGISSVHNIDQSMDKRIHSRLQSRKLFTRLATNPEECKQIFKDRLTIEQDTKFPTLLLEKYQESLENCLNDADLVPLFQKSLAFGGIDLLLKWMKSLVYSIRGRVCDTVFTVSDFQETFNALTCNTALELINDLTIYELAVLICVKRIEEFGAIKGAFNAYNFDTVFSEYTKFVTGGANTTNIADQDVFRDKTLSNLSVNRVVLLTAFERLLELRYIKLSGASKTLVDTGKGKKKDITKLSVRLHRIHPSEIERYFRRNKDKYPSELVLFASRI